MYCIIDIKTKRPLDGMGEFAKSPNDIFKSLSKDFCLNHCYQAKIEYCQVVEIKNKELLFEGRVYCYRETEKDFENCLHCNCIVRGKCYYKNKDLSCNCYHKRIES